MTFVDADGAHSFGPANSSAAATVQVHHPRFYRSVVSGGSLGAAESYVRGDWSCQDLTAAMRILARNQECISKVGASRWIAPLHRFSNWLQRNTKAGSRRNIAAHYDLSNEFFALMLDPTMTYSSGIYATAESTLEQASREKYDRICRQLNLQPRDHILEIGTGWGGFAVHAAKNYGCRITTTTISQQQHDFARQRFEQAGVTDHVTLLKQDYRDLQGHYDKLVSIEMIEAVGEKYLPKFFAQCSKLLKPNGRMALQAITMPDQRYDSYRRSVDFIRKYIFPGGFLPSLSVMSRCVGAQTDMTIVNLQDIGSHYARTLADWRHNFWANIDRVRKLGFADRFVRTWHYYLCYCEAGFAEGQIGVSQLTLAKPRGLQ